MIQEAGQVTRRSVRQNVQKSGEICSLIANETSQNTILREHEDLKWLPEIQRELRLCPVKATQMLSQHLKLSPKLDVNSLSQSTWDSPSLSG